MLRGPPKLAGCVCCSLFLTPAPLALPQPPVHALASTRMDNQPHSPHSDGEVAALLRGLTEAFVAAGSNPALTQQERGLLKVLAGALQVAQVRCALRRVSTCSRAWGPTQTPC